MMNWRMLLISGPIWRRQNTVSAVGCNASFFCLHVKDGQPDGTCEECQRISKQLHPDVLMIEPDGRQIKVDQVRYLKSEFSKSAVEGSKKRSLLFEMPIK